jgi:hypothetical protein
MALVKLGGGITDIVGSIGGITYARNRYGIYQRSRVKGVNPNSDRQSAIRSIVADVAAFWSDTLTIAQRAAWAVFGAAVPAKNKLGETIYLTGFNQFVKSNIALVNGGQAMVATGPTVLELPGEDTSFAATIDAGTGKISLTFDDTKAWLDEDGAQLIVQMGLPKAPGVNFFGGPWRHAGVLEGDETTPVTSPDASLDVPYPVGDGQKVWCRAKIQRADGRLSDWFQGSTIVATA